MAWSPASFRRLLRRPRGAPSVERVPLQAIPRERWKDLERSLGYRIRDHEVFTQALQHRSFHQHSHHPARSNERLEFLGDSILNLIVGEFLFRRYPGAEEGDLTKLRSRLVNRKALAAYARKLRLSEFILMSPSAAQSGGKGRETITADTFEAIVAAVYLDRGFNSAKRFVEGQVLHALENGAEIIQDENYKSKLLEFAQSRGRGIPRYLIVKEEGPDHDRTFTVEVVIGGVRQGSGTGKNKKEAEQVAAKRAFAALLAHANSHNG
jgi:ribonuclease-3